MLKTEMRNEKTTLLDKMTPLEICEVMNEENMYSVLAVEKALPEIAQAIDLAAEAIGNGGKMVYIGAGTSGRLGIMDAAECPPTFGVDYETGGIEGANHMQIPAGMFGLVAGRSGLNFKHGVIVPQGTIDSGYMGSIKVKLYNLSGQPFMIHRGDRIAQIIFLRHESPELETVDTLSDTERGSGGFGSTGV